MGSCDERAEMSGCRADVWTLVVKLSVRRTNSRFFHHVRDTEREAIVG